MLTCFHKDILNKSSFETHGIVNYSAHFLNEIRKGSFPIHHGDSSSGEDSSELGEEHL